MYLIIFFSSPRYVFLVFNFIFGFAHAKTPLPQVPALLCAIINEYVVHIRTAKGRTKQQQQKPKTEQKRKNRFIAYSLAKRIKITVQIHITLDFGFRKECELFDRKKNLKNKNTCIDKSERASEKRKKFSLSLTTSRPK